MNSQFVLNEEVSAEQRNVATLVRFIRSLTMLRNVFIPVVLVIFFAACAPPYFLWFLGELVDCGMAAGCSVTYDVMGIEVVLPLTLSSLLMIALVATATRVLAWTSFELTGQWSTQIIQAEMMRAVSEARTTFFDENPSGRLINRLIGDYGMLRLEGVMSVGDTTNGFAEVLCVGLLIMVAHPVAGLLIVPVVGLYVWLQMQLAPMMSHARELRAMKIGEALHRETDLIEGRTMFKLYDRVDNLLERIWAAFGDSMNIQLFYCRLMAWGMLWMGLISAVYSVVVYGFLVTGIHSGAITATVAAVVITAVFNLSNLFFALCWDLSFLGETASHARRAFFIMDLPNEVDEESRVHTVRQAERVELEGDIRFEDYAMSYRKDSPRILDGLSVTIPAGKKVGIVGRTGAGKSSLMQALFRMVYHQQGEVTIGGRSIFDLDVKDLRRQFGVVPQDPYLFSGTIRFNLAGELTDVSDFELRSALKRVGLEVDLDATVLEGGKDCSVGERQLLCLARLLLNGKRYVLMDEPTSSLDRKTDERIQTLLRTELADRTVITIAHRLESLVNYDLILEMAEGRLRAEGSPREMIPRLQQSYALQAGS